MNNRLTIQELAGALAGSTGKSNESVETFLKEFVSIVRDYVFADRLVQIKGIGNFKIIQVEKRESIDVNTKERIVIPEHYKLSFAPDKDMREIVNKPFAFFESIEIGEEAEVPAGIAGEKEKEDDMDEDFIVDEKDAPEESPPPLPPESTQTIIQEKEEEPKQPEPEQPEQQPEEPELPEPEPEQLEPEQPELEPEQLELEQPEPEPEQLELEQPELEPEQLELEQPELEPEQLEPEQPEPEPEQLEPEQPEPEPEQLEPEQPEPEQASIPTILPLGYPTEEEAKKIESLVDKYKFSDIAKEKEIKLKDTEMADYLNEHRTSRPSYNENGPRSGSNALVIVLLAVVVILIISLVSVLFFKKDTLFPGPETAGSGGTGTGGNTGVFTLPPSDDTVIDDEWGIEDGGETFIDEYPPVEPTIPITTSQPRQTTATTVRVQRGDRLNLFALKYYGNKVFWVYIYQHNQSKLSNPDIIPVDVELVIPAASSYQIDANNPASVKRAFVLQREILSSHRRGQLSSFGSSSIPSSSGSSYSSYPSSSYPSYQGNYGNQPYSSYPQNNSQYNSTYGTGQYSGSYPYDNNTNSQYGTGQYGNDQYNGLLDNSNITPYTGGNQYNNNQYNNPNNQSNPYNNNLYDDFLP
jgi:nucleoid DNA-binding protein/nucleoid-associated protein YgaU